MDPREKRIDDIIEFSKPINGNHRMHLEQIARSLARAEDQSDRDDQRAHKLFILAVAGWVLCEIATIAWAMEIAK